MRENKKFIENMMRRKRVKIKDKHQIIQVMLCDRIKEM